MKVSIMALNYDYANGSVEIKLAPCVASRQEAKEAHSNLKSMRMSSSLELICSGIEEKLEAKISRIETENNSLYSENIDLKQLLEGKDYPISKYKQRSEARILELEDEVKNLKADNDLFHSKNLELIAKNKTLKEGYEVPIAVEMVGFDMHRMRERIEELVNTKEYMESKIGELQSAINDFIGSGIYRKLENLSIALSRSRLPEGGK